MCKCEWLKSHIAYEWVKCWIYKREMVYLPNALRFWVGMWCLPLLWSWSIDLVGAPVFPELSNRDPSTIYKYIFYNGKAQQPIN